MWYTDAERSRVTLHEYLFAVNGGIKVGILSFL